MKKPQICIYTGDDDYYDEDGDILEYGTPFLVAYKTRDGMLRVYSPSGMRTIYNEQYITLDEKMFLEINKCIKAKEKADEIKREMVKCNKADAIKAFASAIGIDKELVAV